MLIDTEAEFAFVLSSADKAVWRLGTEGQSLKLTEKQQMYIQNDATCLYDTILTICGVRMIKNAQERAENSDGQNRVEKPTRSKNLQQLQKNRSGSFFNTVLIFADFSPSENTEFRLTVCAVLYLQSLAKAFPDVKDLCNSRPEFYDQVKIADSRVNFLFRFVLWLVVGFLRFLKPLRFYIDGPYSITPVWDSVLYVNDIANKKRLIYVNDTLILDCKTANNYDKVIPFITGPYSRLILYGNINWKQVKQLISENVKQVRINARIHFEPEERFDIVNFVVQFCRGPEFKFSYALKVNSTQIQTDLKESFRNSEDYEVVVTDRGVHVISSHHVLQFVLTIFSPTFTCLIALLLTYLHSIFTFLCLIIFGIQFLIVAYAIDDY